MAYELNDKLKNLVPYKPLEGEYDIRLDANESFVALPQDILDDAMGNFDLSKINRYPDPYATDLCEAFGKYYNVKPKYVTAGNGSDELIGVIMSGFFSKDDLVLTLSHDFSMYAFYAEIYELNHQVYQKDPETLEVDMTRLIAYINENNVKGIIFSNPCNPTSLCMPSDEIFRLVTSVNALVILDEAYMDFAPKSCIGEGYKYDNLIILRTCSKALGLASIRLGFAVANSTLTKAIQSLKAPYNVNSITQAIGAKVYRKAIHLYECHAKITRARDHLRRSLMNLDGSIIEKLFDTSANFIFMRTSYASEMHARLLERSIAIRLMGDYLRITVGTIKENEAFLTEFKDISDELLSQGKYCEIDESAKVKTISDIASTVNKGGNNA